MPNDRQITPFACNDTDAALAFGNSVLMSLRRTEESEFQGYAGPDGYEVTETIDPVRCVIEAMDFDDDVLVSQTWRDATASLTITLVDQGDCVHLFVVGPDHALYTVGNKTAGEGLGESWTILN